MELIEWTPALSAGFDEIDDDHKKLFVIINKLNESVEDGHSAALIEEAIIELISYTQWHFRHEERLMQASGDPEFYTHKKAHQKLIEQVTNLKARFDAEDESVASQLPVFLKNWLVDHILEIDVKTGRFLADKMRQATK